MRKARQHTLRAAKVPQAVVLLHDQFHAHRRRIVHQRVAAGLVLLVGVDVGVIPIGHRLDTLGPEQLDTGHGAGRTAGVQQRFRHFCFLFPKGRRTLPSSSFSGFPAASRGCRADRNRAQTWRKGSCSSASKNRERSTDTGVGERSARSAATASARPQRRR